LRGHAYLKKLETCKTIGEAQVIHDQYTSDPEAPRLLPSRIINFFDEGERIIEFIESEIQNKSSRYASLDSGDLQRMNNSELFELIKKESFNLYESSFYRDDSNMNVIYQQASLITDEWIPIEIAKAIGVRDLGEGFFYETVEYIYPDFSVFARAFSEVGFRVVASSSEIRELTGY
jgi:hypothetical protein